MKKLTDIEEEAGVRDHVATPSVLRTLSWEDRQKNRLDNNETLSIQKMIEEEKQQGQRLIQKYVLEPKSVMLWSQGTIQLFEERSKIDVVYIDATGSVLRRPKGDTAPYYVYEVVVRHPCKGKSPVPAATYVTCDHTTASLSFFLGSFMTDCVRNHGSTVKKRPIMVMCDGSLVLMQSVAINFCGMTLKELQMRYYELITGNGQPEDLKLPITHRCLSHVMKNAKDLCKKQ